MLPDGLTNVAEAYDGKHIYLFEGRDDKWQTSSAIYRYDLVTDTVTAMNKALPTKQEAGAAVWVGDAAYIFDGADWMTNHAHILRYTTGNADQSTLPGRKPAAILTAELKDGKAVLNWPAYALPNDGYYFFRGTAPGQYDPMPLTDFPVLEPGYGDATNEAALSVPAK